MYISKKFEDLTISDDFMYQLDKGMDYMQLKQSFVIFVCTFDPFQLGRHIYTFTNRCVEDPDLLLNDGTQKIILNTKKNITIDTPPVITATITLYTAGVTYTAATGIHRLLNPLHTRDITTHAIRYQKAWNTGFPLLLKVIFL